jgi:hypothetical protein
LQTAFGQQFNEFGQVFVDTLARQYFVANDDDANVRRFRVGA